MGSAEPLAGAGANFGVLEVAALAFRMATSRAALAVSMASELSVGLTTRNFCT